MIKPTVDSPLSRLRLRNWVLAGIAAATLVGSAGEAFAQRPLTPTQEYRFALAAIQQRVAAAGKTLQDAAAVVDATKDALSDAPPAIDGRIRNSMLALVGLTYAPRFAPTIAEAALADLQNPVSQPRGLESTEAAIITRAAMYAALTGKPNPRNRFRATNYLGSQEPADGAAAVTAASVRAVEAATNVNLLGIVVTAAVQTASAYGTGDTQNGAGGAVTGAISQVAGNSNADVRDDAEMTQRGDTTDDELVRKVIGAAAIAAPLRYREIAFAVGYAFAATYRATTVDAAEIMVAAFRNNNEDALADEIINAINARKAALEAIPFRRRTPAQRRELAALNAASSAAQTIRDNVTNGISAAYSGVGPGDEGIAFNNGSTDPVTDVSGT